MQATFTQPSATANGPYDYTRSGNPTRAQLEAQMADLEVRHDCTAGTCCRLCKGITRCLATGNWDKQHGHAGVLCPSRA